MLSNFIVKVVPLIKKKVIQITEGKRTTRKIIDGLFLIARECPIPEPFSKFTQTNYQQESGLHQDCILDWERRFAFYNNECGEEFYSA